MKPSNHLPDDYKLMTVFDLDKDKKAKKTMLTCAYVIFAITGSLFFFHLTILFQSTDALPRYTFLVWLLGILVAPIFVTLGNYLLETLTLRYLTGEQPEVISDGFYIYFSNTNWYFPRKQMLQIGLLPEIIMIAIMLILIPVSPNYIVSILLYALAILLACTVADFLIASYIWRLPKNTMIHQNRSRFEIYRYNKLNTSLKFDLSSEEKSLKETGVQNKSLPDEVTIDENKLKEKELAKFNLDSEK